MPHERGIPDPEQNATAMIRISKLAESVKPSATLAAKPVRSDVLQTCLARWLQPVP